MHGMDHIIKHIIKLIIREWFLCSVTVSVQLNVLKTICWLNYVFFTVRRRNGVMVSGVFHSAQQDTPYCDWRRGLHTPRTGGTHFGLIKCTVMIIYILTELNWTSNKKLLGCVNEFKYPAYWRKKSAESVVSCPVTAQALLCGPCMGRTFVSFGSLIDLWIWWIQKWNLGELWRSLSTEVQKHMIICTGGTKESLLSF